MIKWLYLFQRLEWDRNKIHLISAKLQIRVFDYIWYVSPFCRYMLSFVKANWAWILNLSHWTTSSKNTGKRLSKVETGDITRINGRDMHPTVKELWAITIIYFQMSLSLESIFSSLVHFDFSDQKNILNNKGELILCKFWQWNEMQNMHFD